VVTIFSESDQVRVPSWVVDLESFRRWADADDFPKTGRIGFLKGEVWVDMSKEQVFSHVLVKTKFAAVLGSLAEAGQLGMYLVDGVLFSNEPADVSAKPDGLFVANATLQSGRVQVVEGMEEGYLEVEGSPDMVLEVVSRSSVRKD
jgi:hypothetical protein